MREDQQFLEPFRKNKQFEEVLNSINDHLSGAEAAMYKDLPEDYATIHIIGCPRSGTTLLNQLVSSCMNVGYINNLIAVFWKTPVHGIILSKKLLGLRYSSDYGSDFGKTNSVYEPHEFTYFWSHLLNYQKIAQQPPEHDDSINWHFLRKVLTNMCLAFDTSIVFKSLFLGWHMRSFIGELKKTLFIYIERDVLQNAWSLLQIRKKYFGSITQWASVKPLEYEHLTCLDPYQQVVAQVCYLNRSYQQQLASIPAGHYLTITYEELCRNPADVLNRVHSKLKSLGIHQQIYRDPPSSFINQSKMDTDEHTRLQQAYKSFSSRYLPAGG